MKSSISDHFVSLIAAISLYSSCAVGCGMDDAKDSAAVLRRFKADLPLFADISCMEINSETLRIASDSPVPAFDSQRVRFVFRWPDCYRREIVARLKTADWKPFAAGEPGSFQSAAANSVQWYADALGADGMRRSWWQGNGQALKPGPFVLAEHVETFIDFAPWLVARYVASFSPENLDISIISGIVFAGSKNDKWLAAFAPGEVGFDIIGVVFPDQVGGAVRWIQYSRGVSRNTRGGVRNLAAARFENLSIEQFQRIPLPFPDRVVDNCVSITKIMFATDRDHVDDRTFDLTRKDVRNIESWMLITSSESVDFPVIESLISGVDSKLGIREEVRPIVANSDANDASRIIGEGRSQFRFWGVVLMVAGLCLALGWVLWKRKS